MGEERREGERAKKVIGQTQTLYGERTQMGQTKIDVEKVGKEAREAAKMFSEEKKLLILILIWTTERIGTSLKAWGVGLQTVE